MIEQQYGDMTTLVFEGLDAETGLVHAFATRPRNFAPHHGPGRGEAVHWRRRLCQVLGVSFDRLTSAQQVHGAELLPLTAADAGLGRDGRDSAIPFVDGLVTDLTDVPIMLLSADCPLVCVYDPRGPAVGAVHASWRGTVAGAAANLVRQLGRAFGSDPRWLRAAISPSAGPCCYEVSDLVRRIARTRLEDANSCFIERDGRLMFDLWTANYLQLAAAGLPPERIEIARQCTICDRRFWSHRRDGPDTGRNALLVCLR